MFGPRIELAWIRDEYSGFAYAVHNGELFRVAESDYVVGWCRSGQPGIVYERYAATEEAVMLDCGHELWAEAMLDKRVQTTRRQLEHDLGHDWGPVERALSLCRRASAKMAILDDLTEQYDRAYENTYDRLGEIE